MRQTYWDRTGKHQGIAERLHELVPAIGPVTAANSDKLNRFRAAANAYYDIFNNGGCNRDGEIREIFGQSVSDILAEDRPDFDAVFKYTERKMDRMILAAAQEQGLI